MPHRPTTAKPNPLASLGGPFPSNVSTHGRAGAANDPFSPAHLSDVAIASLIATDPAHAPTTDIAAAQLADAELQLTRQEIHSSFAPLNPLSSSSLRPSNPFNSQYQKLFQEAPTMSLHERISSSSLFASTAQINAATSISSIALPLPPGLTSEDLAFLSLRALPDYEPLATSPIPLPFGSTRSLSVANADALAVALVSNSVTNTLTTHTSTTIFSPSASSLLSTPEDPHTNRLLTIQPTLSAFDPPAHTSSIHLPVSALTLHHFAALLTLINSLATPPSPAPPACIPRCQHPAAVLRAGRNDVYTSDHADHTGSGSGGSGSGGNGSGSAGADGSMGMGTGMGMGTAHENGFARNGQWIAQYITPSTRSATVSVPLAPVLILKTGMGSSSSQSIPGTGTGIDGMDINHTLTNITTTTPSIDALLSMDTRTNNINTTTSTIFSVLPFAAQAAVAADRVISVDNTIINNVANSGITGNTTLEMESSSRKSYGKNFSGNGNFRGGKDTIPRLRTRGSSNMPHVNTNTSMGTGTSTGMGMSLSSSLTAPARALPVTALVRPAPVDVTTQRPQSPGDAVYDQDAEENVKIVDMAVDDNANDGYERNEDNLALLSPPHGVESHIPVPNPTDTVMRSITDSGKPLFPSQPNPLSPVPLTCENTGVRWLSSSLLRQYILLPALAQDSPITRAISAVWVTVYESGILWIPVDSFLAMVLSAALPWLQGALVAASPAHLLTTTTQTHTHTSSTSSSFSSSSSSSSSSSTSASASASASTSTSASASTSTSSYPSHDIPVHPLPWLRTLHSNLTLAPFLRLSSLAFPSFAYTAAATTHTIAHASHEHTTFDASSPSADIPSITAASMLRAVPQLPMEAGVLAHPFAFLPLLLRRACLVAAEDLVVEREEALIRNAEERKRILRENRGRLRDVRAGREAKNGNGEGTGTGTGTSDGKEREVGEDSEPTTTNAHIHVDLNTLNSSTSASASASVSASTSTSTSAVNAASRDIVSMASSLAEALSHRLSLSHRTHVLYTTKLARIAVDLYAQHQVNVQHASMVQREKEREERGEEEYGMGCTGMRESGRETVNGKRGGNSRISTYSRPTAHKHTSAPGITHMRRSQTTRTRTGQSNRPSNGYSNGFEEEYVLGSALQPLFRPATAAIPSTPATAAVAAMSRRRTRRAKTATALPPLARATLTEPSSATISVHTATASVAATGMGISDALSVRTASSTHLETTLRSVTAISGRTTQRPLTRARTARTSADALANTVADTVAGKTLQPLLRPTTAHATRTRSVASASISHSTSASSSTTASATATATATVSTSTSPRPTASPTSASTSTSTSTPTSPRATSDPLASHAFLSSFGFASIPPPEELAHIDTAPVPNPYHAHIHARDKSSVPLQCILDALVPSHATLTVQQHDPAPPLGLLMPSSIAEATITEPIPRNEGSGKMKSGIHHSRNAQGFIRDLQYGFIQNDIPVYPQGTHTNNTHTGTGTSTGTDTVPLERNPYQAISAAYDKDIIGSSYACLAQVFGSRPGLSLRLKQCMMFYAKRQVLANAARVYRQQYARFAHIRMSAIAKMLAFRRGEVDTPYLSDDSDDDDNFYNVNDPEDYYEQENLRRRQKTQMQLNFTSQLGYGEVNLPVTRTAQILHTRTMISQENPDFEAIPIDGEISAFPSVSPRAQPLRTPTQSNGYSNSFSGNSHFSQDEHSWRPAGGLPALPPSDIPLHAHDEVTTKHNRDKLSSFLDDDNCMNVALPVPPQCGWVPSEGECLQQRLTCSQVLTAMSDAERAVARDDALFMTRVLVYLCDATHTEDREWLLTAMHPNNVGAVVSSVALRTANRQKVDVAVDVYAEAKSQLQNILDRSYTEAVAERLQRFLEEHVVVKAVVELTRPEGTWRLEDDDGMYDGIIADQSYIYDDEDENLPEFDVNMCVGDEIFPVPEGDIDSLSVDENSVASQE